MAKQEPVKAKNITKEEAQFIREHREGLSKTTQRAKWIHNEKEHEDHPGQTLATQSHDVVRHWADERHAKPASVPHTEHGGRPGVLRFNFPGYSGKDLQEVAWDDWFRSFDDRRLVFLYQEHLKNGNPSNFFQLDSPEREGD
jgi:hypothetical protein